MAYRKKYKPCILKYKALILKYVPYIFRCDKCLINNNLQKSLKKVQRLECEAVVKNRVRSRFSCSESGKKTDL